MVRCCATWAGSWGGSARRIPRSRRTPVDTPDNNANLAYTIDQTARLLLTLRMEGKRVLLHCAMGRSRTPAVAARYAVLTGAADPAGALRATTAAVHGHSGNPELTAAVLALGGAPTPTPAKEATRP